MATQSQSQQPSHTLRILDKITKTFYFVMSLSPLKVFQRFKELFAGRSPSVAAAIREAEKRQPAAAFKPPVVKVIGPGGIELTRKHKFVSAYKDENSDYIQLRENGSAGQETTGKNNMTVYKSCCDGAYEYYWGEGFHYWNNGLPGYQASARLTYPDGSVEIYLPQDCPQNRGKDLV